MRFIKQANICSMLLILLIVSACQNVTPVTQQTMTSPTLPESTKTPGPTCTATLTSTATPSMTPSPTATTVGISLAGTPLPVGLADITIENIEKVQKIACWGTGRPNVIQLSKDGQVLAVGTDRGAYFYDSAGFFRIAFIETSHPVTTIAFSSNNNYIALGQPTEKIDIYDRYAFTFILALDLSDLSLSNFYEMDLVFFQQDTLLISVIRTKEKIFVVHWQTLGWELVKSFVIQNGLAVFINEGIGLLGVVNQQVLRLQSLLFSEDSKTLPLSSMLSAVYWDQFIENQGDITPTANGKNLLINNGSSILNWEIVSNEITYQLGNYPASLPDPCLKIPETCRNPSGGLSWSCQEKTKPPIETIALTPDNIMMITSRNDMVTEFRRIADSELAWEINAQFTHIQFSPGSEFFLGLRIDGIIEKRNSMNGALMGVIDAHPSQFYDLKFSPEGSILAASFNNDRIIFFDACSGQVVDILKGIAASLEFSPDGTLLAAGLLDGITRIFDLDEDQSFDLSGHQGSVSDLAFSADSQKLLTGSADCTISLWDINKGEEILDLIPKEDTPFPVQRIEFSPLDTDQYLVGNMGGLFAVTEAKTTSLLQMINLRDIALSQDALTLVVTGKNTYLFNEINNQAFNTPLKFSTHGDAITLNNAGDLLILAAEDRLFFWSIEDALLRHSIHLENIETIVGMAISPDNTLIAVGYQNGLIDLFAIKEN